MKRITGTAVVFAAALAACGGTSPEKEIRATEVQAVEALTGAHPERACQFQIDHDGCIVAVAQLKAFGMDARAVAGIPDDWRDRVDQAKVTVSGSTATLAPGPTTTGKTAHFVLRGGHWLVENR